MQVWKLFSPQNAVKAVQAFKSHNWTEIEFLDLLSSIARHESIDNIPEPALDALYNYLPSISNPLVRHTCINILPPANNDHHRSLVGSAFLNTDDVEMACTIQYDEKPNNELVKKLVDYGLQKIQPKSLAIWAKLFEFGVNNDNIQLAKSLWHSKPDKLTVIGEPTLLRFIELVGRHKDQPLMEAIIRGLKYELPITAGTAIACLNCFSHDLEKLIPLILENEELLSRVSDFQDFRHISDLITPQILQICHARATIPPLLGNLMLQGLFRKHTSQTVFHFYRYLVKHQGFRPNKITAQILANSAYRLGNSKTLSYEIWNEFKNEQNKTIKLDRKFYETMLMCQLVGSSYFSIRFFLAEMARKQIPVRKHIRRMIYNKCERLGNMNLLVDIGKLNWQSKYERFDVEKANEEAFNSAQAIANTQLFLNGKSPDEDPLAVLSKMLEFDERRSNI